MVLAGMLMIPLVGLVAWNVVREARQVQERAARLAADVAQVVAAETATALRDARHLAGALAARPLVAALDGARCDPQLAELPALVPYVASVATFDARGQAVCVATGAVAQSPLVGDPPALHRPPGPAGPTIGPPYRLAANRWIVPVAETLRDPGGGATGAVVVGLALARLAPMPPDAVTAGSLLLLVDAQGRELLRVPGAATAAAGSADEALVRAALALEPRHGVVRGADGAGQVVGVAPVPLSEWSVLAVSPAATALRDSVGAAWGSALAGALMLGAGIVFAYLMGRSIERPMRAIALTARRYAEGDADARAPVEGAQETADIAARFNAVLDRLPRIESQLRESEQRLELVLSAAQEGILVYDAGDVVTFANDAAARLFGHRDRNAMIGRRARDLLPPELQAEADRRLGERREVRGERYEVEVHGHDGVRRWLYLSVTPLHGADGAFQGVLGLIYDISERKDVEARLARITRLYWALSEINEAVVRTTDRETLFRETCRIVVAEGGFATAVMHMHDPQAASVTPVATAGRVFGPIGQQRLAIGAGGAFEGTPIAVAVRTGEPQIVADFFADPRNRPGWDAARAVRVHASGAFPVRCNGEVVGALAVYAPEVDYFDIGLVELMRQIAEDVSFALDVYDRAAARDRAERSVHELNVELERRVAERTARLTEANQELESFSYSVSHDLRAPVRAINGFARLLAEHARDQLDAESHRLLGNIVRSSTHMGRLIDDLLTFAQLGRGAVELRPVALGPAVDRAVEQLRPVIDATRARVDVATELPTVLGDPTLLHQMLTNLLGNALEYRRPDRRPDVEIGWARRGDDVELWVADDGIGIAPEHHAKIFEMFARLHAQSAHPGTGVGLALVAKAVTILRGRVWVESREGEGATFRVRLRAAPDAGQAPKNLL